MTIITIIIISLGILIVFITGQHCGYQQGYDDGEADTYKLWAERISSRRVQDEYVSELPSRTKELPKSKIKRYRRKKHKPVSEMNRFEKLKHYYGDMVKLKKSDFKPKRWSQQDINKMVKRIEKQLEAEGRLLKEEGNWEASD